MGRGGRDPQPLQRTGGRPAAAGHRASDVGPLPALRRRTGIPLRIPGHARIRIFHHQGGAHAVRHGGRPQGLLDSGRLRHPGVRIHRIASVRNSRAAAVGSDLESLPHALQRQRGADLVADAYRRRALHQPPRSGAGRLPVHAPGDRPRTAGLHRLAHTRRLGMEGHDADAAPHPLADDPGGGRRLRHPRLALGTEPQRSVRRG